MAIGLTAALIGSAIIGAGASAISAGSSKSAINKATAAQQQTAADNNALTKQIYDQNVVRSQPFVNTGVQANNQINALLGFGGPGPQVQQPIQQQPNALGIYGGQHGDLGRYGIDYIDDGSGGYGYGSGQPNPGYINAAPQTPQDARTAAMGAYDQFKEFGGYTTRLDEANRGINTGYAARGLLQSGAALKALSKFNQDYASGEFGNYMGYLGNQQNVGLTATNALAGVSTNYANTVSANNNNAASAISNGALAKANVNNQMYSSIAGGFGNALGSIYGSSYGSPQYGGGMYRPGAFG